MIIYLIIVINVFMDVQAKAFILLNTNTNILSMAELKDVRANLDHLPTGASTLRTGLLRASAQWLLLAIKHTTTSKTKTRSITIKITGVVF